MFERRIIFRSPDNMSPSTTAEARLDHHTAVNEVQALITQIARACSAKVLQILNQMKDHSSPPILIQKIEDAITGLLIDTEFHIESIKHYLTAIKMKISDAINQPNEVIIAERFREAVQQEKFFPVFQAIIGETPKIEVLTRFVNPELQNLEQTFDIAEGDPQCSEDMGKLSLKIMEQSFQSIPKEHTCSFNMPAKLFYNKELLQFIEEQSKERSICLEITERNISDLDNSPIIMNIIKLSQNPNISLVLDDIQSPQQFIEIIQIFLKYQDQGTAFSQIITGIKLDKLLVGKPQTIQQLMELATNLGIPEIILEGIEDTSIINKFHGITGFQGYGIGKPQLDPSGPIDQLKNYKMNSIEPKAA